MSITFLHIADLHLDTPFKNIQLKQPDLVEKMQHATKQSLQRLVQEAIARQVDAVLIVGDSFNSEKPNIQAQVFFKEQLEKLVAKGIQVCVVYGNHDYAQKLLITLPNEVHVFGSEVSEFSFVTRGQERVSIYGFSYMQKHIAERKIAAYPVKSKEGFAIGLLHGSIDSQQSGGQYAPFSLRELNDKRYDYWALGHIHKKEVLQENPPIVYSGNIQGLNRHETGAKGGVFVTLNKQAQPQLEWFDTQSILWEKESVPVFEVDTVETIIARVKQLPYYRYNSDVLLSVEWEIRGTVATDIVNLLDTSDMKLLLQQDKVRVYHESVTFIKQPDMLLLEPHMQTLWQSLLENGISQSTYQETLNPVFNHNTVRALFDNLELDEQLKAEIWAQAVRHVMQSIQDMKGETDEN